MSELNLPQEFRKLEEAIAKTHTTAGEIFSIRQLLTALSDARDEIDNREKNQENRMISLCKAMGFDYQTTSFKDIIDALHGECGYACGYVVPYGFVPEADCPVHDTLKVRKR